jgi:hypothetical protein
MGRWFPDLRPATEAQTAAYRQAVYELHRNSVYESAAGIRQETPEYLRLNDRAAQAERPLSPIQAAWHWQRAAGAQDRDMTRLQRASDRQARQQRRARRRGSR